RRTNCSPSTNACYGTESGRSPRIAMRSLAPSISCSPESEPTARRVMPNDRANPDRRSDLFLDAKPPKHAARRGTWLNENRGALEAYNRRVAEQGILSDEAMV